MFRGATKETFKRIYEFPRRERLHEDVGVIFIEIVQPVGKTLDMMAHVAIAVDKVAKRRDQKAELTNRIRSLLSRFSSASPDSR